MYVSINNILYFIGAVLSIMMLIPNSSSILSFFSRKRIIQLLRDENQELDDALKALRKWYYYDYDAFTVFPIMSIFLILAATGAIQFNAYVDRIVIVIVYLVYLIFNETIIWKLKSLYQKKVDEVTLFLRRIADWTKIADAIAVSSLVMIVLDSGGYIFYNIGITGGLVQIIVLSVVVIVIITFLLFLSSLVLRNIERNYVVLLNNERRLPTLSVKIKLKKREDQIVGILLLLDYSRIVIQEADGYKISFEYSTVETIGAKPCQKNE